MSSVSNGLYFLTLPLVSVMRIICQKIRHARYLYIKRNVEKVWGARYLSKNTILKIDRDIIFFIIFTLDNFLLSAIGDVLSKHPEIL